MHDSNQSYSWFPHGVFLVLEAPIINRDHSIRGHIGGGGFSEKYTQSANLLQKLSMVPWNGMNPISDDCGSLIC